MLVKVVMAMVVLGGVFCLISQQRLMSTQQTLRERLQQLPGRVATVMSAVGDTMQDAAIRDAAVSLAYTNPLLFSQHNGSATAAWAALGRRVASGGSSQRRLTDSPVRGGAGAITTTAARTQGGVAAQAAAPAAAPAANRTSPRATASTPPQCTQPRSPYHVLLTAASGIYQVCDDARAPVPPAPGAMGALRAAPADVVALARGPSEYGGHRSGRPASPTTTT